MAKTEYTFPEADPTGGPIPLPSSGGAGAGTASGGDGYGRSEQPPAPDSASWVDDPAAMAEVRDLIVDLANLYEPQHTFTASSVGPWCVDCSQGFVGMVDGTPCWQGKRCARDDCDRPARVVDTEGLAICARHAYEDVTAGDWEVIHGDESYATFIGEQPW